LALRTFREAAQSEQFTLSAELTVRRETTADDVRRQADVLGRYVDGIQLTDTPYSWVQMSTLAASCILLEHGVDPIPVLTCRDRNRFALQSDLLGLQALGVTSLILMRGPRVPKNHSVPASTVFDLTGRELIALAATLDQASPPGPGNGIFIGTAARAFRPKHNWRAESLAARAAAGARFIQTQLCFNMDLLRQYMGKLVESKLTQSYAVMVTLSPLPSAATANWLKKSMTDSRIPDNFIARLENARDPEQEGIRICAELLQEVSGIPGVSGVNLMTTGDPEAIPAAIEASGLRTVK
jgi:methylenetetrahydrofolate reductase (NADPH)